MDWVRWREREKVHLERHTEMRKRKRAKRRHTKTKNETNKEREAIILSIVVQVALNDGIVWHRSIQTKQHKYINYKAIVLRCKAIIWLPFKLSQWYLFFFGPSVVYTAQRLYFAIYITNSLVFRLSISHIWVDWCWYFAHDMFHCPLDEKIDRYKCYLKTKRRKHTKMKMFQKSEWCMWIEVRKSVHEKTFGN